MSSTRSTLRTHGTALRAMIVFTVVLGLLYPAVVLAAGLTMPARAGGSLQHDADGTVVGSALIGQSFTDADGVALAQWFQSRPSAGGYDAQASGGSNLGPTNPALTDLIAARSAAGATAPDALTASGSGLDPDISPAGAYDQASRVAAARGLDVTAVSELIASKIRPRDLGFLGEERVNVLDLNRALVALEEKSGR